MTTFHHATFDSLSGLIETLNAFTDAGIDPAFDAECEELERQFAELRLASNHH